MPPQFIVLHHTGPWPALNWLTVSAKSDVSAHRYIEPGGMLYKCVADEYVANTAGYADVGPWSDQGGANFNLVALQIEGAYNPATELVWSPSVVFYMACQCVEWIGKYGLLPIVYHSQVDSRKDDPKNFPRGMFDQFVARGIMYGMLNTLNNWAMLKQ